MTTYPNEDEQLEAVKKWWSENGKSIVLGVVLGFSALFGWQGWQSYQLAQGQAASDLYTAMLNQATSGDIESASATGKRLLGEHTGSVYAGFAALKLAQFAYARGDKPGAVGHLEWVSSNVSEEVFADLAKVRLARLQLDLGQVDAAEAQLNAVYPGFMPGVVAELRGDIAQANGDLEAARQAYILALASGEEVLQTVRMKLLAIGSAEESS